MKKELRNIDIHILSLVDKGANQKTIIWKSTDAKDTYKNTFKIRKKDDDKKIVYGIVYSPDEEDAQGHCSTADEIHKACYNFMKNARTKQVDKQHDLNTNQDCYVGENWIVKEGDALFANEVDAWATAIKVENEEIWDQIKKGEITGISMYGTANVISKSEDITKEDSNFLKRLKRIFETSDTTEETVNPIAKDFHERLRAMTFRSIVNAFAAELDNIVYTTYSNESDRRAAIDTLTNDFMTKLDEIEVAKSIVEKAGKMISDANLSKLQNAITMIQSIVDAANKNIQKSLKINNEGDSEMTPEEIKKQIDDAVQPLTDSNEALKKENDDLKVRLEKLEKESKGSQQVKEGETEVEKSKEKKTFGWLG